MADNNGMDLYTAYLHAHHAAESFHTADTIKRHAGRTSDHYIKSAAEFLTKAADMIGYDLVKREAVKVEEAA